MISNIRLKDNTPASHGKIRAAALISAATLLLVSVFSLSGCSSSNDAWYPAGMQLASSEDADYKMWVPDSWTIDMSTGISSAYVGGGDYSNVSVIALNLSGEDNYLTPAEYWESYKSDLETTFPDIAYGEDGQDGISILIGETAAAKYTYSASVTGAVFHFMNVVCIRNGTVYLLTYTAQPALYDEHLESVQKILDNFSFKS